MISKLLILLSIPCIALGISIFDNSEISKIGINENNTSIVIKKGSTVHVELSAEKYSGGFMWIPCPAFRSKFIFKGEKFVGNIKNPGDYSMVIFDYKFNEVGLHEICLESKRSWENEVLQKYKVTVDVR
jgi:hypothetical protein